MYEAHTQITESKEKIIQAAITVFARKGKHGARMEDIANESGFNKAMVYYYFTNREILYQVVLDTIIRNVYTYINTNLLEIEKKPIDPAKKLSHYIRYHFTAFSSNPDWTKIIIEALSNDPEKVRTSFSSMFDSKSESRSFAVYSIVEEGIKTRKFRNVDAKQMIISILGMNMIYYLAKPIGEVLLNLNVDDETSFLDERVDSIVDLVLHGVVKK